MRLRIETTDEIVTFDGVDCRVWKGTSERGVSCFVLVHRVAVERDDDAAEFEAELQEQAPPSFDPVAGRSPGKTVHFKP